MHAIVVLMKEYNPFLLLLSAITIVFYYSDGLEIDDGWMMNQPIAVD